MYSDDHGKSWNYSSSLLLPGDECQAAELSNGTVLINMRGHDLAGYDRGNPNLAMRWLGFSDSGESQWPKDRIRILLNASSAEPMHFGGDCEGTMVSMPATDEQQELLVMGAVEHTGGGGGAPIGGRSDYRLYRSWDSGVSWEQLTQVVHRIQAEMHVAHVLVGI